VACIAGWRRRSGQPKTLRVGKIARAKTDPRGHRRGAIVTWAARVEAEAIDPTQNSWASSAARKSERLALDRNLTLGPALGPT
jgi:hypothetical protein